MSKSNWLEKQVSLYKTHSDNIGRPASYREILFSSFGTNMKELVSIRKLDINDPEYKIKSKVFKAKLQCFTPAALLESKAKDNFKVIERTGLMQLDFDYEDIKDYDIEELKQAVFYPLPFIACCGLSCSGNGFYALALISDPDKINLYAEHCFEVLKENGIKPDESKGKKIENLRYISYDANFLYRENPEPLIIKNFKTKVKPSINTFPTTIFQKNSDFKDPRANKILEHIAQAQPGQRMTTISKYAYTLGGLGNPDLLYSIKGIISSNSNFSDDEANFLKCAISCFNAGSLKPLNT